MAILALDIFNINIDIKILFLLYGYSLKFYFKKMLKNLNLL